MYTHFKTKTTIDYSYIYVCIYCVYNRCYIYIHTHIHMLHVVRVYHVDAGPFLVTPHMTPYVKKEAMHCRYGSNFTQVTTRHRRRSSGMVSRANAKLSVDGMCLILGQASETAEHFSLDPTIFEKEVSGSIGFETQYLT